MLHLNVILKIAFNRPRNKAFGENVALIILACLECNVIDWPLFDQLYLTRFHCSNWHHIETIVSSI